MNEVRAQIAELTLEEAAYAAHASCVRRAAWHVPYSVEHICKCHVSGNATPVIVRICICQAARHVMRASTARTGAESATCTSHATMYTTMRWKTPYTMPPVSTSYTTQVCGFTRRTHGAVFKPRGGEFEARRSVRCLHEGEHDVGCIPARR